MATPTLPQSAGRNLVLCFDGTANKPGEKVSNVIRLGQALKKTDGQQLLYYQPGIGTYVPPTKPWAGKAMRHVSMLIDKAFAWHLDEHVMSGYEFLMDHYTKGDRIYLFGFSRGAYIARCLAGMLCKVGLLLRGYKPQLKQAYSIYKDHSHRSDETAHTFRHDFSQYVRIEFLGVWDSVVSVGLGSGALPLTSYNDIVNIFRQALALDERRVRFGYSPWVVPGPKPTRETSKLAGCLGISLRSHRPAEDGLAASVRPCCVRWRGRDARIPDQPNCREVWFSGGHSDIGGRVRRTAPSDHSRVHFVSEPRSSSNPSLLWMVQQIKEANLGLVWDEQAFLHADSIRKYHELTERPPSISTSQSEALATLPEPVRLSLKEDAKEKLQDQLSRWWSVWWLLEYLPLTRRYVKDGEVRKRMSFNGGRGREVHQEEPEFHVSVKMREISEPEPKPESNWSKLKSKLGLKSALEIYKPRATTPGAQEPKYVEF